MPHDRFGELPRGINHIGLTVPDLDQASQFLAHGLGARDDALAMQYLVPGWTFDPKRPALDR